jgi:hypothetical protein
MLPLALAAAAPAEEDRTSFRVLYEGKTPSGDRLGADVEVGDVVEITVEGPTETRGSTLKFSLQSSYDVLRITPNGWRLEDWVIDKETRTHTGDQVSHPTTARLFHDYWPRISVPGAGAGPLLVDKKSLRYVVKRRGKVRIEELKYNEEMIFFEGTRPQNAAEREEVGKAMARLPRGSYNIREESRVSPGTVSLTVAVVIRHTK